MLHSVLLKYLETFLEQVRSDMYALLLIKEQPMPKLIKVREIKPDTVTPLTPPSSHTTGAMTGALTL